MQQIVHRSPSISLVPLAAMKATPGMMFQALRPSPRRSISRSTSFILSPLHSHPSRPFTATSSPAQHSLPASYYRGGTSRALFLHQRDLPADRSSWPAIFHAVLGSPDPNRRQLDGMGGGVSSLSRICLAGPAQGADRSRAEVEYTMVAVGVKDGMVDVGGICGNITAAVGPWAWEEGVLERRRVSEGEGTGGGEEMETTVRLLNTNTGKVIR